MPTQEEILAAQAREAAGAAAAAQANAAYRNNTNPILPTMGSSGLTQAEVQDAANEAAKHAAAFHTEDYYGFNYADLANTPLSQIASRYGTNAADMVQGHYTENPTAKFQEINRLYNDRVGVTATGGGEGAGYKQGSFVPTVLAGEGGFTGRAADYKAAWAPLQQSKYGMESLVERTDVVPTRDLSTAATDSGGSGRMETWGGRTFYVPYGERTQQELLETKAVYYPEGGRVGFYQVPRSIYESEGGFQRKYGWETASGSTGALQSGMFSIERPLTPDVRTQWAPGNYAKSADVVEAQEVRWNPQAYSRMGAEAYGGTVTKMDNRTLAPGTPMGRYAPETGNMANLVNPYGVNRPKSELQATEPWKIEMGSPVLQTMGGSGIRGTTLAPAGEGEYAKVGVDLSGRLHDGWRPGGDWLVRTQMQATVPKYGTTEGGVAGMPKPFISKSTPTEAPNEYQPSGFLGLGGLLPKMPTSEQTSAYLFDWSSRTKSDPVGATLRKQSEMISPVISTVSGVASRLSFGATDFIYKPEPITVNGRSSQSVKTEIFDLPTTRNTTITNLQSSSTLSGGNQTITDLGNWLTSSRDSVDRTNPLAVKDYNTKADLFEQMQKQNPMFITTTGGTRELTTETGGTRTVSTITGESSTKTYATEWDKFVEGSGRFGRYLTGETLAKQEAYFTTIKTDSSLLGEAKRGVFTIGTTIINKPAELAPAAILGFGMGRAASMVPGFLAEVGAGTGVTARTANFLMTPGGASIAKAGVVGVFGGAYTYDVTEGLTASPEQTKKNIYSSVPALAAMYGGAGGFNWIGETRVVRGASSPTGATFRGVQIQNTFFGGGRTPTGARYVGAFSPTESYVFAGRTPTPAARTQPLRLPDLSNRPVGYTNAGVGGEWEKPIGLPDLSNAKPRPTTSQSAGGMYARPESVRDMNWDVPLREEYAKGYVPSTVTSAPKDFYNNVRDTRTLRQQMGVFEPTRDQIFAQEKEWRDLNPTLREFMGVDEETGTMKLQPQTQPISEPNPLNPKRGYAPTPIPFTIKGASNLAVQKELANMNPAYSERMATSGRSPMTLVEREYPYTRIEQEAIGRRYRNEGWMYANPSIAGLSTVSPEQKRRLYPTVLPRPISTINPWSRTTTDINPYKRVTEITSTKNPSITDIIKPYSKNNVDIVPYKITTPREKINTRVIPQEKEFPWKRITETPKPYKEKFPLPPEPAIPITGLGGGLPGGGGGGGSRGYLGVTTWRRNNLVADMPYLTKGMDSLSLDAGLYNDYSTPKTRRKSKRRKK